MNEDRLVDYTRGLNWLQASKACIDTVLLLYWILPVVSVRCKRTLYNTTQKPSSKMRRHIHPDGRIYNMSLVCVFRHNIDIVDLLFERLSSVYR